MWIFAPNKAAVHQVETEQDRYLKFFNEAETLDDETLPEWMQTPAMRQAMSTLTAFSEKDRAYHAYQARQEFLRQQRSIQQELEKERAAKEAERQAKESALQAKAAERQAKEAALAEVARLQALLNQSRDA